MAHQEAPGAPAGRSRPSTSPAAVTRRELSPRQMQTQPPCLLPSWSPYAAAAAGAHLLELAAAPGSSSLPMSEHVHGHAWSQQSAHYNIAGVHGASIYTGNFLSLLEAKSVTPEMFEDVPAACDYLGGVGAGLGPVDRYSVPASTGVPPPAEHETASSPLVYSGDGSAAVHESGMGCMPCYDDQAVKAFLQPMIPSRLELQSALGYCSGIRSERLESSVDGVGGLPDAGLFSDYRSAAEFMSSNCSRHEEDASPGMGSCCSGNGAAASVVTRRKSEERAGGNAKKPKQKASSKASPPKPPEPKVKLGEKITALQQVVSPFGKTDTASVLFETIKYIKFLHDQIRLFSEPYMAKSTYKGRHIRFGVEETEENAAWHDLRGRGLCLVPVSLTSQAYHDDTLPDCWEPAYRSCLYR